MAADAAYQRESKPESKKSAAVFPAFGAER